MQCLKDIFFKSMHGHSSFSLRENASQIISRSSVFCHPSFARQSSIQVELLP